MVAPDSTVRSARLLVQFLLALAPPLKLFFTTSMRAPEPRLITSAAMPKLVGPFSFSVPPPVRVMTLAKVVLPNGYAEEFWSSNVAPEAMLSVPAVWLVPERTRVPPLTVVVPV